MSNSSTEDDYKDPNHLIEKLDSEKEAIEHARRQWQLAEESGDTEWADEAYERYVALGGKI